MIGAQSNLKATLLDDETLIDHCWQFRNLFLPLSVMTCAPALGAGLIDNGKRCSSLLKVGLVFEGRNTNEHPGSLPAPYVLLADVADYPADFTGMSFEPCGVDYDDIPSCGTPRG
jgi:hypothetical protein